MSVNSVKLYSVNGVKLSYLNSEGLRLHKAIIAIILKVHMFLFIFPCFFIKT